MQRLPSFAVVAVISLAVVPSVPRPEPLPGDARDGVAACDAAVDADPAEPGVDDAGTLDVVAVESEATSDGVSTSDAGDCAVVDDPDGPDGPDGDAPMPVTDDVPADVAQGGDVEPAGPDDGLGAPRPHPSAGTPPAGQDAESDLDAADPSPTTAAPDEDVDPERPIPALSAEPDGSAVGADDVGDETVDVSDETVDVPEVEWGLRAQNYDGVYAQGVPIAVAMAATRELESGGNYLAEARGSTASGAYQIIDTTWNGYGGYPRAVLAPPVVQDQFAYESMVGILKRFGNDVSSIPVAWYYPVALREPRWMDLVPAPWAGNVLTPREYQARWMAAFHRHLEAGSPVFLPADTDALIPAIAFPVLGPTSFWDDWHAPRDGGARRHEGIDFMGEIGQPLRAAFDGVVTGLRPTDTGLPGVGITITREDGLRANYFHLDATLRWHPDLEVGDRVRAGQIIGFMGATGNAGVPHLHFELRTPEGEPIAPHPAVLEAVQREQCSVGIGPWSTAFASPAEIFAALTAIAAEMELLGRDVEFHAVEQNVVEPTVVEIEVGGEVYWTISSDGAVTATGRGAQIAPEQGACTQIPTAVFGPGAAGLAVDALPAEWWGDDVDAEVVAAMVAAVEAERLAELRSAVARAERTELRSIRRFRHS